MKQTRLAAEKIQSTWRKFYKSRFKDLEEILRERIFFKQQVWVKQSLAKKKSETIIITSDKH